MEWRACSVGESQRVYALWAMKLSLLTFTHDSDSSAVGLAYMLSQFMLTLNIVHSYLSLSSSCLSKDLVVHGQLGHLMQLGVVQPHEVQSHPRHKNYLRVVGNMEARWVSRLTPPMLTRLRSLIMIWARSEISFFSAVNGMVKSAGSSQGCLDVSFIVTVWSDNLL